MKMLVVMDSSFKRAFKPLWFPVFLLVSLLVNNAFASEHNAVFDMAKGHLNLQPYLEIFSPESELDPLASKNAQYYTPLSSVSNNLGFNGKPVWIRFAFSKKNDVQAPEQSIYLELESPIIDKITLYVPGHNGSYQTVMTGDELSMSTRDVYFRDFLFHLPPSSQDIDTYYLKVESKGTVQLPLVLWTERKLIENVDKSSMMLGGYFSFLVVLLLMSIVAYIRSRQRVILFYIAYLSAYFFLQFSLNGLSFQYFWPDTPQYSGQMNSLAIGLAIACGLLFCLEYLQITRQKNPLFYQWIILFWVVVLCGCLNVLFGSFSLGVRILILCGMLLLPSIIPVAFLAYRNGVKRAKYLILAWAFLLIGVFIAGLHYLGLVPYSPFTFYAMPIGSLIEMTILCFVMIASVDELRKEKEKLSAQASEYLNQLHHKVDELVSHRTKQLEEINGELEKRASLDEMTGLLNHTTIKNFLGIAKTECMAKEKDLALILVDIDNFKGINDKFGHLAGDDVICTIASVIQASVRSTDFCGRYGGDEFLLILPSTNVDNALRISESIRKKVAVLSISAINGEPISVSIGVSMLSSDKGSMIEEADTAMYCSKKQGRNQVTAFQPSAS